MGGPKKNFFLEKKKYAKHPDHEIGRADTGDRLSPGRALRADFHIAESDVAGRERRLGVADAGAGKSNNLRAIRGVVRDGDLTNAAASRRGSEGDVDLALRARGKGCPAVIDLREITGRDDAADEERASPVLVRMEVCGVQVVPTFTVPKSKKVSESSAKAWLCQAGRIGSQRRRPGRRCRFRPCRRCGQRRPQWWGSCPNACFR